MCPRFGPYVEKELYPGKSRQFDIKKIKNMADV